MKILIIGNGAREHAISWTLFNSPSNHDIFVSPGNAGTNQFVKNIEIDSNNIPGLLDFAKSLPVDLTIVGPEIPLSNGIVDEFQKYELPIFGPSAKASMIESSKSYAKRIMTSAGVPTAKSQVFTSQSKITEFLTNCSAPVVIKADGLAAGKGVIIAQSKAEIDNAIKEMFVNRSFGEASDKVLVEEFLEGNEISVFGFVDGEKVSSLVPACDYKKIFENDLGPNTGGMGAYSPPPIWSKQLENSIRETIFLPVAKELVNNQNPYKGLLYAGLMITKNGPMVIEFNCRFGDPEAQVILPRMKSDLAKLCLDIANGNLIQNQPIEWDPDPAVTVVIASGGYPENYTIGHEISGLKESTNQVMVFHAGTELNQDGKIVTSGGRVLSITAKGSSFESARNLAYKEIESINFKNAYYRTDIASKILEG
ncbi:MAG: phosphoribosylamine--glycine ligase [Dehalococcoidia bacterium]